MWTVKVPHIVYEEIEIDDDSVKNAEDAIYYVLDGKIGLLAGPEDLATDTIVDWGYLVGIPEQFEVSNEVREFD